MAERSIDFCVPQLQFVWNKAREIYERRFSGQSQPFLTCTYRSPEEQAELYAQGRTKPGKIVTQLKKGGKHNSNPSLAFDVGFKDGEGKLDWSEQNFKNFAAIVKEVDSSVEWGGDWKKFKDLPHFQV